MQLSGVVAWQMVVDLRCSAITLSWAVLFQVLSAVNAPRTADNTKGDALARFSVNDCIKSRPFYDVDVREDTRRRGGRCGLVLGTPGTRRIVAIFWSSRMQSRTRAAPSLRRSQESSRSWFYSNVCEAHASLQLPKTDPLFARLANTPTEDCLGLESWLVSRLP